MERAVTASGEGLFLNCRLLPSSSRDGIAEVTEEFVKIKVTPAPVDGEANKRLAQFLSRFFKVPQKSVTIVKGKTGKRKKILLKGLSSEKALNMLKDFK